MSEDPELSGQSGVNLEATSVKLAAYNYITWSISGVRSYDYDLVVVGGGSGGLACSKEGMLFVHGSLGNGLDCIRWLSNITGMQFSKCVCVCACVHIERGRMQLHNEHVWKLRKMILWLKWF